MKKVLVFLADGFEMCEALCVVDVLRRAKVDVTTVGIKNKSVVSSHSVAIEADKTLSEVKDTKWDSVFCPGGMPGAINLRDSEEVNRIIMDTYHQGGIVSAICASPSVVLGPLGLLEGKKATCFPGCEEYSPNISFSKDGVVTDGNIVTGKSAGWAFDLGLELISLLLGKDKKEEIRNSIYYKEN